MGKRRATVSTLPELARLTLGNPREQPEPSQGACRRNASRPDVFVPGEGGARSARSGTDQCADGGAFPATRQSSNDRAHSCPTTNHCGGTLTLSFLRAADRRGFDGVVGSTHVDRSQFDLQTRRALKSAQGLGVYYRAGSICPCRNHSLTVDFNRAGDSGREGLSRLTDLRAERLAQAHGQHGAGWNCDRFRSFCFRGGRFCGAGSGGTRFVGLAGVTRGWRLAASQKGDRQIQTEGECC